MMREMETDIIMNRNTADKVVTILPLIIFTHFKPRDFRDGIRLVRLLQRTRELAETVKSVVDYRGQIVWDQTMPDGTPRKGAILG